MATINFLAVRGELLYQPLPRGKYFCTIDEIMTDKDTNGHEMWSIRFKVVEGKYEGRFLFDCLLFKGAGLERVKNLCEALGLDVSREINLTPDLISGRSCAVATDIMGGVSPQGAAILANVVVCYDYSHLD